MLEWKVKTGLEKVKESKQDTEGRFDAWFYGYWAHSCSREKMLSPESPLPHVYALMCLPPEEVKEFAPAYYYETCSDCGKQTDVWIQTKFSFCDEYGCGLSLCPDCAEKLKRAIEDLSNQKLEE